MDLQVLCGFRWIVISVFVVVVVVSVGWHTIKGDLGFGVGALVFIGWMLLCEDLPE